MKKKPYVPPRLTVYDPKKAQPETQKPTPTLLICDDNPNIRFLLRTFVESRTPYNICGEASHGIEAIEKAKELRPDLILLDLSMPIMTGAEAAVILKRIDAAHENNSLLDALGRYFKGTGNRDWR